MGRMNDEDLKRLLKTLPAESASTDFTDRVLARLDHREGRRGRRHVARAAAIALSLAAVGLLSNRYLVERYERSRAAERIEAFRTEYRELEEELAKLRALASELQPMLELGGTEDVEFVFDLRELASDERGKDIQDAGAPRLEPASHAPRRQE